MRIISKIIFIVIFLFLSYFAFLLNLGYKFISSEDFKSDQIKSFSLEDSTNFTFENIDYYITPFNLGFKITGLKQTKSSQTSLYLDPIYVGMNFFTFNFYIKYDGKIESNTSSEKFITELSSIYNLVTDINIFNAAGAFSSAEESITHLKLINADLNKISITSQNKSIVEANSIKFSILPTKQIIFDKTINNTIKNIFTSCSINAIFEIKNDYFISNLPKTIFTFFIPGFSLNGSLFLDIDSDNLKNLQNLNNSKIKMICDKCISGFLDFSGKVNIDTKSERKNIQIDANFSLKEKLTDFIHTKLSGAKLFKNLAHLFLKQDITKIFDSSLPKINFNDVFHIKSDSNYSISNDKISLVIENFILGVKDGSSLAIKGKTDIVNFLEPNIEIESVLSKSSSFVKYWLDYYYNILNSKDNHPKEYVEFNNQVTYSFLKQISLYPDSSSDNLMFKIIFNNGKLLIDSYSSNDIKIKYFSSKTNILMKNLKTQKNPKKYIEIVAPEAKNYINDLIETETESKISNELWQRLIR